MSRQPTYRQHLPLILYLIALLISGCGQPGVNQPPMLSSEALVTVVPAPEGLYGRIAWIDDWLILTLDSSTNRTVFASRLWRFHPDGAQPEQLRTPDHAGCEQQGVEASSRLPDNRLGYLVRCGQPNMFDTKLYMMAYDLQTARTTSLIPYALPSTQVGTGGYSWNPTMTRGITSDGEGRGLYEQLYWLNPDRSESLDVGMPQAFAATWSPDGAQIAFLGAPEQGLSGVARADAAFDLYLMNPDGTQQRALIQSMHFVASMAWSADSRWIALPASLTTRRADAGLWMVDVTTGNYQQIVKGDFGAPVFSPDGRQLAAIRSTGEYPNTKEEIVIVDIGSLPQAK